MFKVPKNIRGFTPSELAFRLSENVRFFRERSGRIPQLKFSPGWSDSPNRWLPEPLFRFTAEKEPVIRMWQEFFPESAERTVALADEILENRIPVFSQLIDYPDGIDWHLEPVSGKQVPLDFYRDIDTMNPDVFGDTKYIWEINRHNYLVFLGQAYWARGRREYYQKWRDIIVSWIDANPYHRGINWESSLELAFRSINWIWSGYFFRNELESDDALQKKMFETLYLQADHIYHHLSYYFSPNTHLTGEALGLL